MKVALRLLSLLAFFGLPLACDGGGEGAASVDPASRRSLPAGEVVGFTGRYGSHAWRGIPYARAPVGPLRWRAPQPAPRWEGVREAVATAPPCPQLASVFAGARRDRTGVIGREDCLYLDVWAPRFEPGAVPEGDDRLPVMLWIHGGGNTIGYTGFYDGGHLAQSQKVVVVAVQYRLGPLGWLRHAALRGEGTSAADRSGNYGTLDLIRALEWVRDSAPAFGGDPERVTIFGESAGATNVLSLLLSPRAEGLFHRAIMQSGGLHLATLEETEALGYEQSSSEILLRLLAAGGSAPDRAAARERLDAMDDREIEAYLRDRSPRELLAAYAGDRLQGMYRLPTRFRDGTVLPETGATARIEAGDYSRVPVLLGTNRDEDKVFMAFDPELAEWRFGLFPRPRDRDRYEAEAEHLANAWKARSVDGLAARLREAQGPSVYAYRWDWDEEPGLPFLYDGAQMLGAAHGLEIAFVFGHWDLGPQSRMLFTFWNREGREKLSRRMMSYWANFAYTGAPERGREGSLPPWPAWDASGPEAPKYVILDTPSGGGIRTASRTYTAEEVAEAVAEDPRLDTAREKCSVLFKLTDRSYLSPEQYAAAGGGVCRRHALDDYPWTDVAAARRAAGS